MIETISIIITIVLLPICFAIILWVILKKGLPIGIRNFELKLVVDEIVHDYGNIGSNEFIGKSQVRLLKCRKKGNMFYVLEATQIYFWEPTTFWTPIDNEMAKKLIYHLNNID